MSEVDMIFDAIGRASQYVMLQDERANKLKQIRSVTAKRCGNCYHWMKSSCKPEKELKQFKSCNSFACQDFEFSESFLLEKFQSEFEEIDNRIQVFLQPTQTEGEG